MKFKDWNSEYLHHGRAVDQLRKVAERCWPLGEIMVRVFVTTGDEPHTPHTCITAHVFKKQEGGRSLRDDGSELSRDGYYDYEHRPLEVLTSGQLARIAMCKAVVERWISGEIESLPVDAPEEIPRFIAAMRIDIAT